MASIIAPLIGLTSAISGLNKLFFGVGKHAKIGDLVLDVCLTEVITLSSTITEHPVETKEAISDHIFKNPLRVKLEGYITDAPSKIFGVLDTPLLKNSVNSVLNNIKALLPFNESTKPSIQAYQLLTSLYEKRELINVVTKLNVFQNMAIENITFYSDQNTGERLEFSAELIQIRFATVRKSYYSGYKQGVAEIAAPKSENGIAPKSVEPSKSWATQGWDKAKEGWNKFTNFITPSDEALKAKSGLGIFDF